MKKWSVALIFILLVVGLYFVEFSKIKNDDTSSAMPTLDELEYNTGDEYWEYFYKVRATIIDGQRAEFEIPKNLKEKVGKEMELQGAAVFFSNGCKMQNEGIAVHSFFLYPTLGLANACSHLPEVAMRWTVRINLKNDWDISRTDMIDAKVRVKGTFRIDTAKPYEAAFFIDNASVELLENEGI